MKFRIGHESIPIWRKGQKALQWFWGLGGQSAETEPPKSKTAWAILWVIPEELVIGDLRWTERIWYSIRPSWYHLLHLGWVWLNTGQALCSGRAEQKGLSWASHERTLGDWGLVIGARGGRKGWWEGLECRVLLRREGGQSEKNGASYDCSCFSARTLSEMTTDHPPAESLASPWALESG